MPEQGFLARSGLDSINIGGRKVPIALIGGGIALVGVMAVLRARQKGQQVATVGQPYTAASTGFGLPGGPDYGPMLANLSQQLTGLSQSINGSPSAPPAGSPPVVDPSGGKGPTGIHAITGALGDIPVWLHIAPSAESPVGALLRPGQAVIEAGAPMAGGTYVSPLVPGVKSNQWLPVNVGGSIEYAFLPEVNLGVSG